MIINHLNLLVDSHVSCLSSNLLEFKALLDYVDIVDSNIVLEYYKLLIKIASKVVLSGWSCYIDFL